MRLITWRALSTSLMDSARHVIGCHLTRETRVPHPFDDVASTIHQSLAGGGVQTEHEGNVAVPREALSARAHTAHVTVRLQTIPDYVQAHCVSRAYYY